jgi:hypothetical protein
MCGLGAAAKSVGVGTSQFRRFFRLPALERIPADGLHAHRTEKYVKKIKMLE